MRIVLSLLFVLALAVQAYPQASASKHYPRGHRFDEHLIVGKAPTAEEALRGVFSEIERRMIERYFGKDEDESEGAKPWKVKTAKGKSKVLPPGLAKRATLPPGLARHVRLHGSLAPGLQKRDLPEDLETLLPEAAPGQERVIVDDDVVLIEKATGLILDVIEDVILGGGAPAGS